MQTEALLISGQILAGNDALERETLFPQRKLMTTQHTPTRMHACTNANINWWIYAHWHQWVAWQATIIQPQGSISHIRNAQRVQLRRTERFRWIALMNKVDEMVLMWSWLIVYGSGQPSRTHSILLFTVLLAACTLITSLEATGPFCLHYEQSTGICVYI